MIRHITLWWKKMKKNVIHSLKDEKGGKMITQFTETTSRSCSYCVQKMIIKCIEDSDFVRTKVVRKSISKELTFSDYEKDIFDPVNTPITKVIFWSTKHAIYSVINNKIALCKLNDKEILHDDGVTRYPLGSNIPFLK